MITPNNFLQLAKKLSSENNPTDEMQRRNSIRLLYYFFFHQCFQVLKSEFPKLKEKKDYFSHKELRTILARYDGNNIFLKNAKKDCPFLWLLRVKSDYLLLENITEDDLDYTLELIDRYS